MAAIVANMVRELLALAGVDNILQFNGETQAQRLSTDMFDDTFTSCMDKTYEELDSDLNMYSFFSYSSSGKKMSTAWYETRHKIICPMN